MVKGLNPADKARKEARKKEIKKNKKQRQLARSAAIESKDPEKVIEDLEKLDKLEFDIVNSASLQIYKDKRKRLKETWAKILAYHEKDTERHAKLKKIEANYEAKYKKLTRDFEAIKAAQEVKVEDVFLPPEPNSAIDEISDDDPLLSETVYVTPLSEGIKPPGCPPGFPPDFKELVDSLKNSLFAASIPIEVPSLPMNLIDFHLRSTRGPSQSQQNRPRAEGERNRSNQPKFRPQSSNKLEPKGAIDTKPPTKTAVIESKPVLFKPKATKFVPSSVRSKLVRNEPRKDD